MFRKQPGFSLFELMVVIAIIGIMATIAIPNFVAWRNNSNLRGAAFNLKSDIETAKSRAVRGGGVVSVSFDSSKYEVFIDSDRDAVKDGGEVSLFTRNLNGITMTPAFAGTPAKATGFDSRGQVLAIIGTPKIGMVELNNGAKKITVSVNMIGSVSITM